MIPCIREKIQKEYVDAWIASWEALRIAIHASHDERNKQQATQLMEQAIMLYESFIREASGRTEFVEQAEVFELMPLNGYERLAFIKMRPGQYACYRQLDELFKETKKRAARLRIQ